MNIEKLTKRALRAMLEKYGELNEIQINGRIYFKPLLEGALDEIERQKTLTAFSVAAIKGKVRFTAKYGSEIEEVPNEPRKRLW